MPWRQNNWEPQGGYGLAGNHLFLTIMYSALPPNPPPRDEFIPDEDAPARPWGKILVVAVLVGAVGWLGFPYWKYRLPQERDLTNPQGATVRVRLEARNDLLLKCTLTDTATVRYFAIASLAPADREFVGHLKSELQFQLPLDYVLVDAVGAEISVRLTAHDNDWLQYTLNTDGSTHYRALASLPAADQLLVRLLPASLHLNYPVEYAFTGPPLAGAKIRLVGRNSSTFKYMALLDRQTYSAPITSLSASDQSFVRALPLSLPDDQPAIATENPAPPPAASPPVAVAAPPPDSPPVADSTANPPAVESPPAIGPITANQIRALVYIEGDESSGSGFIAHLNGQSFVVTNEHVLSGNKKFSITASDGSKLPTNGTLYGAVNYDVALLKIPDGLAKYSLEIVDDAETHARVSDEVTVMGNNLGARVPVQIDGKLLGIGPEMVEVDAKFQPGNSGSPIIDRVTGKVIGIATMHIVYDLNKLKSNVVTNDTRWFGYRLDNIDPKTGWQKLDWAQFSADGLQVAQVDATYKSLIALVSAAKINPDTVDNDSVRHLLVTFQAAANLAVVHKDRQDYATAMQTLNSKLRYLVDNTIKGLTDHPLSAYHAKIVEQQKEIQKYLDEVFVNTNKEIVKIMHNSF